jgi:predicted Zn finger-like uncharacterized protein
MSKFQTKRDTEFTISRNVPFGVSGESVVYKAVGEADLTDVNRRVTKGNTDGDVVDLARRIAQVYRQTIAPTSGVSKLSRQERVALRDRLVAAMTSELESDGIHSTPAITNLASVLVGLTDELEGSSAMSSGNGALGKSFPTLETICPYCKKVNAVEKNSSGVDRGLQDIRCTHCSKSWSTDLSFTGKLEKSAAGSTDLAELRTNILAQVDELTKKIKDLQVGRTAANTQSPRFNTGGFEKRDVASKELDKALANGKPATWGEMAG